MDIPTAGTPSTEQHKNLPFDPKGPGFPAGLPNSHLKALSLTSLLRFPQTSFQRRGAEHLHELVQVEGVVDRGVREEVSAQSLRSRIDEMPMSCKPRSCVCRIVEV